MSNSNSNFMAGFGGSKFMDHMFRPAPDVVWDMMTGKVGVTTADDSIATLSGVGDNAEVEINLINQFGMAVPAFAQSTATSAVQPGDLIYFGASEKPGWVIEIKYGVKPTGSTTPRPSRSKTAVAKPLTEEDKSNVQFVLMKTDGQRTQWKVPKVQMLGMGAGGVMVIRSLLTMLPGGQQALGGMQNNLMLMMQMSAMSGGDGVDLEQMMPMMLMSQMQGGDQANGGFGNIMSMMMMSKMFSKDGNGGGFNLFGGGKKDDKSGYNQPRVGNGKSPFQG